MSIAPTYARDVQPYALPAAKVGKVSHRLRRLRRLAHWMDAAFRIPLIGRRIGLDSVIGLVPGLGDVATTAASAVIVLEAYRMGVPRTLLLRMLLNIGLDASVGSIPLLGDLFDMAFKANLKNVALLEEHLSGQGS